MNLSAIYNSFSKPAPFTPGDAFFWTEPYIAEQLLKAHLDPNTDAASRRPETIEKIVKFWLDSGLIHPGDKLLDLGCGPGLYALPLAQAGVEVTGIDLSANSLTYAREQADAHNQNIRYLEMNFLDLDERGQYDVVIQVYGEFCTLSDADRDKFLSNIHRALKPGGLFLLDITTWQTRLKSGVKNNWAVYENGFWRKDKHLVLEMGFAYPEQMIWLDQYIIVEMDGKTMVDRNWFHDYSPAAFTPVAEKAGFAVKNIWGDLAGSPYEEDGDWFAAALQKISDQ